MYLTREQCQNIKGWGILLIMIHNFVSHIYEIECNEMVYTNHATDVFLNHLATSDCIWYFFSFAGWIGVPLFFFLSGYGLTNKYKSDEHFNCRTYLKDHVIKLLNMLLPLYLIYICFVYFRFHELDIKSIIAQVTFTINLLRYGENGVFEFNPTVYWFFGAILQFYLLFILFRKVNVQKLWVLCLAFFILHYYLLFYVSSDTLIWARHNSLGWGVSFILGIIAAKSKINISRRLNAVLFSISLLILCLSLVNKQLAPFVEVSTILLFVTLSRIFTMKWVCFIGIISPSIFVIHPFVRLLYYTYFCSPNYPFIMTTIYSVSVIVASWLYHSYVRNRIFHKKSAE